MLILVITIIAIYSIWSIALFHADVVTPPPSPRNRLAWRYFMKLHLYIHCLYSAMTNVSDEFEKS